MARFFKNRIKNKGLAPGSLVFIGEQKMEKTRLSVIDYDVNNLKEFEVKDLTEALRYKDTNSVTWINLYGIHDVEIINVIGKHFELHPLLLEDLLNTDQRPKMEEFDNCLFFVMKMIRYDEDKKEVVSEQLSIVLGKNFVLTFQEQVGDVFEPVRERIRKQKGRIRTVGNDYLAYALMDTVVDNYIYTIERIGEQVEDLETQTIDNPSKEILTNINIFKREISFLLKVTRPVFEIMHKLHRLESDFIDKNTLPFIKDLYDLIIHASDSLVTYREILSDYLNIYHTSLSNKMNEVMKVLTIFAAIFIPMTFIAGVYGTNFKYLPELEYKYSYFILWGVFVTIALVMLFYFKRKKWL